MEIGSIYRFRHSEERFTTVFVYKISEQEVQCVKTCALAVNLEDSSDIRTIPQYYWQHWYKVS